MRNELLILWQALADPLASRTIRKYACHHNNETSLKMKSSMNFLVVEQSFNLFIQKVFPKLNIYKIEMLWRFLYSN